MLIVDYLKQFVAYEMSDMEDPVPLILNKYDPHLSITVSPQGHEIHKKGISRAR